MTPPAPWIGSAMKAAIVSAPCSWISFSRLAAQRLAKSSSLSPGQRVAVIVRAIGVDESVGYRQVEVPLIDRDARQAGGGDGDAVIAAHAADDLLLLRPAEGVVVVPDHLDDGVVGLRAGIAEEDVGHRHRRHLHQPLGQLDDHVGRLVAEAVIVGQLAHLPRRRLHQPLFAEAERGAPEAGQRLDIFLAVLVVDIDALAVADDQRALGLVLHRIGVGMQVIGDVARRERVGHDGHRGLFQQNGPGVPRRGRCPGKRRLSELSAAKVKKEPPNH